jgi:isoaspartyl peptidase/L-asparaginase-like protein (Ntn-hydrolase superfamily)
MEKNKKITKDKTNLFITHSEEINEAYERAVREALTKHKKNGNSVVVSRNGEIVTLKPDEIEVN